MTSDQNNALTIPEMVEIDDMASRITGQDQCADAGPCPHSQEPAAWRYEFSAPRQVDGIRDGCLVWHVGYSEEAPKFEVRNLTPLYAISAGDYHV